MVQRDDEITIEHDPLYNYHSVTFGYGGMDSVTIENRDGIIKVTGLHNGVGRQFTGLYLWEFLRAIGVEETLPVYDF